MLDRKTRQSATAIDVLTRATTSFIRPSRTSFQISMRVRISEYFIAGEKMVVPRDLCISIRSSNLRLILLESCEKVVENIV